MTIEEQMLDNQLMKLGIIWKRKREALIKLILEREQAQREEMRNAIRISPATNN